MRFRDYNIAPVVGDVLGAGKRAGRGVSGRTSRNKRNCLVVAESCKQRILRREIMIQANVKLAFVE